MPKRSSVLCLILLLSGCASLPAHDPLRNADGSLNVPKILDWVGYGIEADCALGASTLAQDICTFGRDGLAVARAAVAKDPASAVIAARQALTDTEARLPADKRSTLDQYFAWAIRLLGGTV